MTKKTKKKEKKKPEKKPNLVIKGNIECSNPSMWTTPHVQLLSYVSDEPPSLAQQVDQKLQSIENQFAIASGYFLTSFPSTSTFRRHWVCKSREYSAVVFKIHKSFSIVFVNHCKTYVNQRNLFATPPTKLYRQILDKVNFRQVYIYIRAIIFVKPKLATLI